MARMVVLGVVGVLLALRIQGLLQGELETLLL
jgi:hypothetical protein